MTYDQLITALRTNGMDVTMDVTFHVMPILTLHFLRVLAPSAVFLVGACLLTGLVVFALGRLGGRFGLLVGGLLFWPVVIALCAMAPAFAAEPTACMSAALNVAWSKAPGIQVQRITREGVNPAAVVESFLANAGAPDLNTDDFVVASDAEKVVVTPVRAGQVCRNFIRIQIPLATGGQALLKAIELAGKDRA